MFFKIFIHLLFISFICASSFAGDLYSLKSGFENPPQSAKPGVYWYFLDGNFNKDEMTKDLQSMQDVGISSLIYLEVGLGFPKGPVDFMSDAWQDCFASAILEAGKRNISIVLGTGPGWAGSGSPWVGVENSMKHLMSSKTNVSGPQNLEIHLPLPEPFPLSRYTGLTESDNKKRLEYYEDVKVLAFKTPKGTEKINDIIEKALFERKPFSSDKTTKQYLTKDKIESNSDSNIDLKSVIDLTSKLSSGGILKWNVPQGDWTIMRFAMRTTGSSSRPAPLPGLGFECDKFDEKSFEKHLDGYIGKLMKRVGKDMGEAKNWTTLHIDSWEMGSQNWTKNFAQEFQKRRNYDITPFLPAFDGLILVDKDTTERFLWDVRKTSQELVVENHGKALKRYGEKYGFDVSIEPYDMSFFNDIEFGSCADKPMAEFWYLGNGFDTSFTCIEASSIGHTTGKNTIGAESFTSRDSWGAYPYGMKAQGDWAFCMGINRFFFHTYPHQPLGDNILPGMTFSKFGISWQRHQTFWDMLPSYHDYVARCSFLLQQGTYVSSILYLVPEDSPFVFTAPLNSLEDSGDGLYDKKSYPFDAVTYNILKTANVVDGKICFDKASSYDVLVLPNIDEMTPECLNLLENLANRGAKIIGNKPVRSPSLQNYPECDKIVEDTANKIWKNKGKSVYGKGVVYSGEIYKEGNSVYPDYNKIVDALKSENIPEDFSSTHPIRYIHRKVGEIDLYFVSNKKSQKVVADCTFNIEPNGKVMELWNPVTSEKRLIKIKPDGRFSKAQICFEALESFFVVFRKGDSVDAEKNNCDDFVELQQIGIDWDVSFKGRPPMKFDKLISWTESEDEYIKYYSGKAKYSKYITLDDIDNIYIEFEGIENIARVYVNGKEVQVLWTTPWRAKLKNLKKGENLIEIEVANLWGNRLYGDSINPEKRNISFPDGMMGGTPLSAGKYTYTTNTKTKPTPSGLIGNVRILKKKTRIIE